MPGASRWLDPCSVMPAPINTAAAITPWMTRFIPAPSACAHAGTARSQWTLRFNLRDRPLFGWKPVLRLGARGRLNPDNAGRRHSLTASGTSVRYCCRQGGGMSDLNETRRRFMAHFAGVGLGGTLAPGVLWARMQDAGAKA